MSSNPHNLRLLLVGPLPIAGDHVGGAKVSFQQMVRDMESLAPNSSVVNLSRPLAGKGKLARVSLNLFGAMKTLATICWKGFRSDAIVLNLSANPTFWFGPLAFLATRIQRTPLLIRVFGGDLGEKYKLKSRLTQWLFRNTVGNAEALLLQTESLMKDFESLENLRLFPTTRNLVVTQAERLKCHSFVFISQIRKEKGVHLILEALKTVDRDCSVQFYGSAMDAELVKQIELSDNANYGGQLKPEEVAESLNKHDAMLFPTFWEGEGLPGVIIESFQCGMPVIATRWLQIPELLKNGEQGILIEPHEVGELVEAMRKLIDQPKLYQQLSESAFQRGQQYKSMHWNRKLVDWCQQFSDGTTS